MKTHLNHKMVVGLKDTARHLCLELISLAHILEQLFVIICLSVIIRTRLNRLTHRGAAL